MDEKPLITCRELIDFIADYIADELDHESRSEFERHLHRCPSCLYYLDSYRRTMTLTRELAEADQIATDVPEELVRVILARVRG
jgi:anti-sigma factor RsiW